MPRVAPEPSPLKVVIVEDDATVRQFLRAMIDHDDPDKVLETIFKTGPATKKE